MYDASAEEEVLEIALLHSGNTRNVCWEHLGAKCNSKGAKVPKFAKMAEFCLFFPSDKGGTIEGAESLT